MYPLIITKKFLFYKMHFRSDEKQVHIKYLFLISNLEPVTADDLDSNCSALETSTETGSYRPHQQLNLNKPNFHTNLLLTPESVAVSINAPTNLLKVSHKQVIFQFVKLCWIYQPSKNNGTSAYLNHSRDKTRNEVLSSVL